MNGLIVLVPYTAGQEFYIEYDSYDYEEEHEIDGDEEADFDENHEPDEDEESASNESCGRDEAYLPIFVQTDDEDLALMAVAYAACVDYCYVACPDNSRTAQEWEQRCYSGTLNVPGVELPSTEEAFKIPDPGDCFCCGSLEDYEVRTLEDMKEWLNISTSGYILTALEDAEELWQQFNDWSTRILDHKILNKDSE